MNHNKIALHQSGATSLTDSEITNISALPCLWPVKIKPPMKITASVANLEQESKKLLPAMSPSRERHRV